MKVPVPNQTEVRGILQVSYISHRYLNMGLEVERKKKNLEMGTRRLIPKAWLFAVSLMENM